MHREANRLVIQVQPAEGIQLHFQTKVPDAGMQLRLTDLDFRFRREFTGAMPEAYQRLLLDALAGDASLFARADEVELAWGIIDPIIAAWEQNDPSPLVTTYEPGLWGPEEATRWMHDKAASGSKCTLPGRFSRSNSSHRSRGSSEVALCPVTRDPCDSWFFRHLPSFCSHVPRRSSASLGLMSVSRLTW